MQVKRDWGITLDEDRITREMGQSFGRVLKTPRLLAVFREELAEAQQLVEPAACWETVPVREVRHEKLVLANGTRIGGGPVAAVVGGANDLVVGVCTVGAAISERADAYSREKDMFRGMVLSDLASYAVDLVRQELCELVEAEAGSKGLHVSTPLSPGESEWSVREQATLFSLVDAGKIGVTLSSSMVMRPLKSLSLIIGVGAQPMGSEGGTNCDFCTIRDRCAHRRTRAEAPGESMQHPGGLHLSTRRREVVPLFS
jgi:hypothetical protein